MRNAAQAYGTVARQVASPRELEATLLLKAASRLQAVQDGWDRTKPELDDALRYNRKLWTIFVTSITTPDHPLPLGGCALLPAQLFGQFHDREELVLGEVDLFQQVSSVQVHDHRLLGFRC